MYRTSSTTYIFASSISARFVTWVRMMIRWAPQQPQGNSVRWQRILGPPVFPELRELDPRSSWLSLGPRRRRIRIGVWLSRLLLGIQSLDGFGHEEQRLVGRGCVPLATLAEHRPLEESQLLGGLRQLLLVCGSHLLLLGDDRRLMCDGLLLLGDDGLLIRSCLLQITNPLLAGRQLIGKRWTSVLPCPIERSTPPFGSAGIENFFRDGVMHDAIADDAAHWPSRCLPRSASNRSVASRFRQAKSSHPPAQSIAAFGTSKVPAFQVACTK